MSIFDKWFSRPSPVSTPQAPRETQGQQETQGQREGRRMERLLRVALAETTTEEEFNRLLSRMMREDSYLDSFLESRAGAGLIYRLLEEHKGAGQDWRGAAKRLAAYLPRFYSYQSEWESDNKDR